MILPLKIYINSSRVEDVVSTYGITLLYLRLLACVLFFDNKLSGVIHDNGSSIQNVHTMSWYPWTGYRHQQLPQEQFFPTLSAPSRKIPRRIDRGARHPVPCRLASIRRFALRFPRVSHPAWVSAVSRPRILDTMLPPSKPPLEHLRWKP